MFNGLVPLLFGLILIIFRKGFAKHGVKQQFSLTKKEWPLWSFEIPAVIAGVSFVIIGVIDLLKYFSRR